MALTPVEQQTRASCLNEAIRAHGGTGMAATEIVLAAEEYLAFVEGKKVSKRPEKRRPRR